MSTPYRIMTVCTGNICRSPMAEVVLRARVEEAGLTGAVVIDSTGVSAEERGNPIDRRAVATLRAAGYEVPHRAARQVKSRDLPQRELVLAMTSSHLRRLRLLGEHPGIRMYREFDPAAPAAEPGREHLLDIDDPWYGGMREFEEVLAQIEAAAAGVIAAALRELEVRG